jgi:hypothetical protein
VDRSHIVLSCDHAYWYVTCTVSLYYLATTATVKWIAQGHTVLSGDHGYLPSTLLRCPYTYESGSRVRLESGSNEANSSVCGVSRAGLGRSWHGSSGPSVGLGSPPACYCLVRVWEVPSQTRVSTRLQTQTARVLSLKKRNHLGYHV